MRGGACPAPSGSQRKGQGKLQPVHTELAGRACSEQGGMTLSAGLPPGSQTGRLSLPPSLHVGCELGP